LKFDIQPLYATPVYTELLDLTSNLDLIQDEIDLGVTTTSFNLSGNHKFSELGHGINSEGFNGDWLKDKGCVSTIKALSDAIERYCEFIGFQNTLLYERTSWINSYKKGNYAHIHTHSPAEISGNYYYKAEKDSGSIFFETPIREAACSDVWVQLSNRFAIPPQPGLLVMFPGWLSHGVSTNITDNERISIAFNIKFKYKKNN
jgi:hypothetical protein